MPVLTIAPQQQDLLRKLDWHAIYHPNWKWKMALSILIPKQIGLLRKIQMNGHCLYITLEENSEELELLKKKKGSGEGRAKNSGWKK